MKAYSFRIELSIRKLFKVQLSCKSDQLREEKREETLHTFIRINDQKISSFFRVLEAFELNLHELSKKKSKLTNLQPKFRVREGYLSFYI